MKKLKPNLARYKMTKPILKVFLFLSLLLPWQIMASSVYAQSVTVTGTVTDQDIPMPGVNVVVKGTMNGTITDVNGRYSISVPNRDAVLIFSFIGYLTHEVIVGEQNTIDIILDEDTKQIEEVIVVGYGVQKKSVVTAAVSRVSGDELDLGNPTNVQNALKGKASGVQVISESGQPGRDSKIRIRGTGTVNDSNPLYIVDGITSPNGINFLNPSDIESIEILKDAASAAIYGARGANGVVLVTTKKGNRMSKTTLNYEFSYGIQNPARKVDLMNGADYQMIVNEMAANSGKSPYFPALSDVDTDWQKELYYSNAPVVNHKLSLNGGGEHSAYYASFGYLSQSGVLAKGYADYERYNGRFNYNSILVDSKDRNWLNNVTFGAIFNYTQVKRVGSNIDNSEAGGIIASMNMLPPTETVYQDDPGMIADYDLRYPDYVKDGNGRAYNIIDMREINNPLANLQVNNNQRTVENLFGGNFNLDVSILPGLKFKTAAALDWGFVSRKKVVPKYYLNTTNTNTTSRVEDEKSQAYNWQWDNILTYTKSFGLHHISLLAGTSLLAETYSNLKATDYNLLVVDINKGYVDIATADRSEERVEGGDGKDEGKPHKLASFFGRVNYNYDEKYLFEAVVRHDGSSNFGPNYRYATFPSVSAGWVLSREGFMSGVSGWLNFVKLRASWGQNGNEKIGTFGYTSMMKIGENNVPVGNKEVHTGAIVSGYVNSDLRWETSEQSDFGLDLRLFNSSLTLSADYFIKKTKDMLLDVSLPQYTGYWSMRANEGTVKNEGVELDASYRFSIGEVNLGVSANASYIRNTVTDQGSSRVGINNVGGGLSGYVTWRENGMPYGFFYGYVHDGIFQNQDEVNDYVTGNGVLKQPFAKPGDVRFKDLDGEDGITESDRTMIGKPNPDWTYGITLSADWKGFDLHAFFQGVQGNEIFKYYRRSNISLANWETSWMDRWHGEGTSTWVPRVIEGDPNGNTRISDFFVENGSYFRLKVLQLGYQLPRNLTRKAFIDRLRFYIQGENLFTITDFTGYDPEVGTRNGFDGGTYMQARTFTAGVNIIF